MNGMKDIALGLEDYRELVTGNNYYVDKTLLVKETIEVNSKVVLFTRPRRFGKSLNISMLNYFFNIDGSGKGLFDDCRLARSDNPHFDEYGKYPVIFLKLKDMKRSTEKEARKMFCLAVRNAFLPFEYLLEDKKLALRDKKLLGRILNDKSSPEECAISLLELTRMLYEHHEVDSVILIDEYDVPLEAGYLNGYYDEILDLIRLLLSSSCKTNPHLRLAVHTGCLRIAGESIYTGFNNLHVDTILNERFSSFYGFTPEEVLAMLEYYGLGSMMPKVQEWYDGYLFGEQDIYNPWSILNFAREAMVNPQRAVKAYWSNTSGNDIIMTLIAKTVDINPSRNDIERLLEGEAVTHEINENINYRLISNNNSEAIWNLLFFTGYLKATDWPDYERNECRVPLVLVNREIRSILKLMASEWNSRPQEAGRVLPLVQALEAGKPNIVELEFNRLLMRTVSFRDSAENYYHGFLAGLLAVLKGYICLSNREAGEGVSDIRLESENRKSATIIEVKISKSERGLDRMAATGLRQAIRKKYAEEYRLLNFCNIHVYGIACYGKKCRVVMQDAQA